MSEHDVTGESAGDQEHQPETGQAPETGPVAGEPAEGNGDQAEPELQAAREEIAELKDRYVRLQAEMENVRKRAERDVAAARKYGIEGFARELLGVCDSVEAGLASARGSDAHIGQITEGMELTERMLIQALEKFGVERLNPEGEAFDPEYHEAMSMQPSADHPPNTVVTVVQTGYLLNGRVLRPAMVIVSSAQAEDTASGTE